MNLFKNRNFIYYFLSIWISSLGDAIFIIALTWLLIERTNSPAIVGTYLFLIGVTKLVFILLGGVLTDHFQSKSMLVASNLFRGLIIGILTLILYLGHFPLWAFLGLAVVFGILDSIAEPAQITFRTRIVPIEHYTQSLSLLMMTGNITTIIGPAIGAFLVASGSTLLALLINSTAFIIATFLLLFVKLDQVPLKSVERKQWIRDLSEGFHFFLRHPILISMAIFAFFANATVGATLITIPFFSRSLHLGVEGFGLMNTSIGIGSVVGAAGLILLVIKNPKPWMTLLVCFLQGVFILIAGFSHSLLIILVLFGMLGFFEAAVNIIAPSVNHTLIPKELFGRVISILILVMSASVPLSQALAGWLMEQLAPQTILIYAGLLEIVAALLTFVWLRIYTKAKPFYKKRRTRF
jgi:MFS family permease